MSHCILYMINLERMRQSKCHKKAPVDQLLKPKLQQDLEFHFFPTSIMESQVYWESKNKVKKREYFPEES